MEPQPDVTPFYLDKALWLMLLGPLIAILNAKLNLGLSAEQVVAVILPIVAYVVMHKVKTMQLQKARIEADAASGAITTGAQAAAVLRGPNP